MMASSFQPSRADIDAFLSLVPDVHESEVISRLKGNNNNVEQAIGEYFDNAGSGNKYHWNEAEFSSDREGTQNNAGISFNIHAADDIGPYEPFSGAPSRPPSRTSNNKSPLSKKIIDLSAEHAAADPRTSMSHQDQHDREMEQAMSLSLQRYFGPATRNEYEQGKWEMVPISKSSAQEIMLDPGPAERKRDLDVPAFLKPSIQNHRLNALFTIYHEIPLTRNIFLKPMDVLPSYGNDNEWWTGKTIDLPSLNGEDSPEEQTVDRELQRIMAFLDKTDRSYGSADALANMADVKKASRHWDTTEAAVMATWKQLLAEENHGVVKKVFSRGVESEEQEDTPQGTEFAILDLPLPPEDSDQETIYDIADDMLWPNLLLRDADKCSYLSHVADVIAFRFEGNMESYKKVDIPAVWYPDRYLKDGRQAALEMRQKKVVVKETLEQASRLEDYLTSYQMRGPGGGKVVKVQDLFKSSLRHDEAEIQEDQTIDDSELDGIPTQRHSKAATILSKELQKIMAKIDRKLTALNESKEKAREELRQLSKLYTEPSDDPSEPKLHAYSLRGVSISKSTMYICRRAEPDLIDMDLDDDGRKASGDQWWRIHYTPIGSSPVTVEKTTLDQVLEATKNEIRNAILVYASKYAMDMQAVVLPKALETFVRFDNASFKVELTAPEESQTVGWDTEESVDTQMDSSQSVGLSSPGKRKYRGSGDESNQYQRVNITETELRGNDESTTVDGHLGNGGGIMEDVVPTNGKQHDIIVGVDPSLIMKDNEGAGQEMKERGMMPMLSGRKMSMQQVDTIDTMDLDQVVVEDEHIAEESTAVKRVGFTD